MGDGYCLRQPASIPGSGPGQALRPRLRTSLRAALRQESRTLANDVFVKTCDAATAVGGCLGADLTITNGPSATTDLVIDVNGNAAASCAP